MAEVTPEDKGEYDYEGDMAKSQLRSILANAKRLHDMLKPDSNLPEWVQSKITLAEDYILTAANYMEGEMNEEVDQVEESVATAQKVMDRANVVAKTNPDPKKRFAASGLARKAMLRTINPTGVNTGIVRGGGNKTYRMSGKIPPYQLTKKTGVSEEEMKPYVKAGQAKFDAQAKAQQKGKKQAGTLSAAKEREETKKAAFAQKAVNLAKGKKNRINKDPKVDVDVKLS